MVACHRSLLDPAQAARNIFKHDRFVFLLSFMLFCPLALENG